MLVPSGDRQCHDDPRAFSILIGNWQFRLSCRMPYNVKAHKSGLPTRRPKTRLQFGPVSKDQAD
jgi:hypothetical protein